MNESIFPVLYKLPEEITAKIGHVVVAASYIDLVLSGMIYDILPIGPKEGRIAVKEPSAEERFTIITDLLNLKGINLTVDIKGLRKEIKYIADRRNEIVHGTWLDNGGQTLLRLTKGDWQPNPKMQGNAKRKIYPQAIKFETEELKKLSDDIDDLTARLIDMSIEIRGKISKS